MACDNNQYFEFQEMQLNWIIYRAKMVLINWLIGSLFIQTSTDYNDDY